MDCIFCDIVNHATPAWIVYEDELVIAFFDRGCVSPGHTLVVPKAHAKNIFDIPADSLAHIAVVAKRIAEALKCSLGAQGVNLLHASGAVAQQSIFHFHLHVVPRVENDGLDLWFKEQPEKEKDFDALLMKLKAALAEKGC